MATYKVCSPVPLNGLILYLDSLNLKSYPGTGSVWYDISGQENHFIIRGDIVYTPLRGFSNFIGNSGSIGNKIYSSNASFAKALKAANGGNGYTTLVWAKSDGSGSFMKLLGFADGENYIDLYQNVSTPFGYRQEDGSSLYVDGVPVSNNSYALPNTGFHQLASTNLFGGNATPPTTSLTIGNEPDGSGAGTNAFAWTGSIAAVMMYNRVLTNGEIVSLNRIITQRYIAQGASAAPDPTMVVHLDAGNTGSYLGGNIWYDLSGNGNHAYKIEIPGATPEFSPSGSGSFNFPALTLGPSGGFTINDSPSIRNLNQATFEVIVAPQFKDSLIGADTEWMSIFSKDNGTRTQQRPAISINQNERVFTIETPASLRLTLAGGTTVLRQGIFTGSLLMDWTVIGTLYSNLGFSGLPTEYVAVKTEGYFKAKETGVYSFSCESDDSGDLFIDGVRVASFYGPRGVPALGSTTGTITLTSGSYYTFRARMQDYNGGEGLRVFWRRPSTGSGWFQDNEELSTVTSSVDGKLNYTIYSTHGGNGSTSAYPQYAANAAGFDIMLNVGAEFPIPNFSGSTWFYLAGTFSSTTTTGYVNTSSLAFSNPLIGSTAPIYIGTDSVTEMFKGKIAVVKFHNRALSPTEISASYVSYKTRFNLP